MIKTKRKIFCIMFALLMCFTCFQTTTVHAAFPMYSTGNTIDLNKYKKLKNERAKILKSDVIIGWIADDKIATVYEYFIKGFITDICLFECLRLVDYGKQVVIKTKKGLTCIKEKYKYELLEEDKKKSIEWNKLKKKDIDNRIEELRIKYRGIGNYVDECLETYK